MVFSFMTNFWADVLFTKRLETQRLGVGWRDWLWLWHATDPGTHVEGGCAATSQIDLHENMLLTYIPNSEYSEYSTLTTTTFSSDNLQNCKLSRDGYYI